MLACNLLTRYVADKMKYAVTHNTFLGEQQTGKVYFTRGHKYPRLILDGYIYIIRSKLQEKTVWRCSWHTRMKCRVRLVTYGRIAEIYNEHCHQPQISHKKETGIISYQIVTIIKK